MIGRSESKSERERERKREKAAIPTIYLAWPIKTRLAFHEKSSGTPPSRGRRHHWPKTSTPSAFPPTASPPSPSNQPITALDFGIGQQQRNEQVSEESTEPKQVTSEQESQEDSTLAFFFRKPFRDANTRKMDK